MTMPSPVPALRPIHVCKTKFHPRLEILDEVVAGLLWMQLDLPGDTTRDEMESFARRLVSRIRRGAGEAAIAVEIAGLQSGQLGRPANLPFIRDLACRAIAVVSGAR
jgi:hypothetical protein